MQQWKRQKVDVRVVREMHGVMAAEGATGVIIMTPGLFTQEAKSFAEDKPIDLVEGHQLAESVQDVQAKPSFSANEKTAGKKVKRFVKNAAPSSSCV